MNSQIREKRFEESIEEALAGPPGKGEPPEPGRLGDTRDPLGAVRARGYRRRPPEDYDRGLCLIARDVVDFVQATQPKTWLRLTEHHGAFQTGERFLTRLANEVARRGTLDVLRKGVKDSGCAFDLVYFPPTSHLNPEVQRRYENNIFSVVRQLRFTEKHADALDLALFLNGLPLFTVELKSPLNGQDVRDAIAQYQRDRDPREPLFAFGRCLAHFAVDPDFVYETTRIQGQSTRFLPFNRGKFGGAGNEPMLSDYATAYLWKEVWSPDSVLNLVQSFVHQYDVEDEHGKRTGQKELIFPRYQQLDAVRRLVAHAREHGSGHRYLVQHSAGSGKSNSIAWLAHQLSSLHDADDRRVFDSIVVITDRRVLDRQLQQTVRQFQQTAGIVENIDRTSRQLKEALEMGKTIIVTTLQKFPVIADQIGELPGKRFAIIADEAHSSQSGEEAGRSLKAVFAPHDLAEAEHEDESGADGEDFFLAEMRKRQFVNLPNVSTFAFTATPKPRTLELFGTRRPDGSFVPFSLYSMRQAIEEGFILDVLQNYTTYRSYWRLLKTAQEDPRYEKDKATNLLRSFVDQNELVIEKKVAIMVDHFHNQVAHRIEGKAKAMIVTRSRLHAVRYRLALDRHLKESEVPYRALVAFSGTVRDPSNGLEYTEAQMNGIPERQTAETFKGPEYRFLVVAEKFQTGFDQPLLHTMYVDKKLSGLHAVQALSRLNRVHPEKTDTMVLDFVNEADDIQEAFQPYYETTILSEATDPNLLYDHQRKLLDFGLFGEDEVDRFAELLRTGATMDRLIAALAPIVDRFEAEDEDQQADFRGTLNDYIRLFAFLSQVVTFADASLEKLYRFSRLLLRRLPSSAESLPRDVTAAVDIDSYRIQKTSEGKVQLDRGTGELDPMRPKDRHGASPSELEALSEIVRELNERFGTEFTDEDKVFIQALEERLSGDDALRTAVNTNPPENARLTFELRARDRIQDLIDTDFDFYKRVTDDESFAKFFLDWLFDRYRREASGVGRAED